MAQLLTLRQKRVVRVLARLMKMAKADDGDAGGISEMLEAGLTDLQCNDFFGTEGQNDPRGDFRDADWSMSYVQGIDKSNEPRGDGRSQDDGEEE